MASIIIAGLALAFSIVSFCVSFMEGRKVERIRERLEAAVFDMGRNTTFEARLAEWPEALRFHGIDIEAAKKDGLTAKDIAYIILSTEGLVGYCDALGISIYDQLLKSDYRQMMFAQLDTRKAWKYARLCIPAIQRGQIDRFLKEKYGEEYARV
jgi:hypothetical protein